MGCGASWRQAIPLGACYYYLTTAVVFAAVWIGVYVVRSDSAWRDYLGSFVYVDGRSHEDLVLHGYSGDKRAAAKFPGYILLARVVHRTMGVSAATALVVVTHTCLLAVFVLLTNYFVWREAFFACASLELQKKPTDFNRSENLTDLTLLAIGLWPSTLFFRMAYTESVFLLGAALSMFAMQRRWPNVGIALVVGATTATRPVGVALVAVFAWYLWQESRRAQPDARLGRITLLFGRRAGLWLPLACWGLIAYMVYLHYEFGDSLAFVHAQKLWVPGHTALPGKLVPLLTLKPLWSPYVPGSVNYWRTIHDSGNPLLNFALVNPIVFVLTAALIVIGAIKKWLDSREILLSALLLGIPYVTMAYDNLMLGQARFASVVFPAYIVMARLLSPLPRWVIALFFVICALLLGFYSALFGGGYGQTYLVLW